MSFGRHGSKIRLVPLDTERHFDNCVRWLNDPQVTVWMLTGDYPITRMAEKEFFERHANPGENKADLVLAIETLTEEEEHIGICGLHNISYRHGTGIVGLTIGRPKLWGQGFGGDALCTFTEYAFDVLGLRLVITEAFAENERSVRMIRGAGYAEVGRIPQRYWKRGAYRDMITFIKQRG